MAGQQNPRPKLCVRIAGGGELRFYGVDVGAGASVGVGVGVGVS